LSLVLRERRQWLCGDHASHDKSRKRPKQRIQCACKICPERRCLATIVGINNSKNEAAFPNAVLSSSLLLGSPPDNTAIQYSVSPASDMSVLGATSTISGSWDGTNNEKHDGFRKHSPAASITTNLDTLRVTHGFAVRPATTGDNPVLFAFARGYDPDTNSKYTDYTMGVAGKYGSGRVVVWGDEWVTYDTVWTNEDRAITTPRVSTGTTSSSGSASAAS